MFKVGDVVTRQNIPDISPVPHPEKWEGRVVDIFPDYRFPKWVPHGPVILYYVTWDHSPLGAFHAPVCYLACEIELKEEE